jgi:hypothetical protein
MGVYSDYLSKRWDALSLAAKQRYADAGTTDLERETDELANALHGLTPEEVEIADRATK